MDRVRQQGFLSVLSDRFTHWIYQNPYNFKRVKDFRASYKTRRADYLALNPPPDRDAAVEDWSQGHRRLTLVIIAFATWPLALYMWLVFTILPLVFWQ